MTTITQNGSTSTIYIQDAGSGTIQYKINTGGSWTTISSWPVTITNSLTDGSNTLKVLFSTDILFNSSASQYFICGSTYLQFGDTSLSATGSVTTITVNNISSYPGLIQNGTASPGQSNVSVYNIFITATGTTTLKASGGWIGQELYARNVSNNLIVNCSSDGAIPSNCGGIVGNSSVTYSPSSLTIRGCSSKGAISSSAGGIVGSSSAGSSSCTLTIEQCWSSGSIGINAGGMTGNSTGINGGTVTCTNCYSTGSISANAGGIFGITNGYGSGASATASNCYSTGSIDGGGGGIFGANAGTNSGSAVASNCYSTGDITSGGGGIYATNYDTSSALSIHCYTSGSVAFSSPLKDGIYAGSSSANAVLGSANNYSEGLNNNFGWNDTNAKLVLQNYPSTTSYGTTWSQVNGTNTAFVLSTAGYTPYSSSLTTTASGTAIAGTTPSSAAIASGYTFSILQINSSSPSTYSYITINSSTGALTAGSTTPVATYTIIIYSSINPYSITTYTLDVTAAPSPPAATVTVTSSPCCVTEKSLIGLPYEYINNIRTGSALLAEHNVNPTMRFSDYAEYLRYKMAQSSTTT